MNYRRAKVALGMLLLGAALLVTFRAARQWQAVAMQRTEVRVLADRRAALEARVEMRATLRTPAESPRAEWPAAEKSAAPAGKMRPWKADGTERRWMADPGLQKLYLEAERASLPGRYAGVVRLLGLDAEGAAQLAEAVFQRNERRLDVGEAARTLQLDEDDPALARNREQADAVFRRRVTELFGEPAYAILGEYERALPAWELVNRFAGAVAVEGEPLTPAQAVSLVETLTAASPPYQAGGTVDPNQVDWPVVLAEAEPVLSPAQQVSFTNMAPIYRVALSPGATASGR